jgi:hypothetical protein
MPPTCCCQKFNYCSEIIDSNNILKYYIFSDSKCNCGCKCLKRKTGLNFNIYDINKKPISSTIHGRNNKNYGKFFEDSYSYEITFPLDAEPDTKLTLLHSIYIIEALCEY